MTGLRLLPSYGQRREQELGLRDRAPGGDRDGTDEGDVDSAAADACRRAIVSIDSQLFLT